MDWIDKYVNIPYKLHSRTMEYCDCYGLAWLIYKNEFGIELPKFDELYSENSDNEEILKLFESQVENWKKVSFPNIGDLIYLRSSVFKKHVGVFVGNNKFLHNTHKGATSTIADLKSIKWRNRIIGYYRYE